MIVVMQETVIVCTAVTMMGIMQSTMILVIQMYIYVVSLLLNECTSISFFEGLHTVDLLPVYIWPFNGNCQSLPTLLRPQKDSPYILFFLVSRLSIPSNSCQERMTIGPVMPPKRALKPGHNILSSPSPHCQKKFF